MAIPIVLIVLALFALLLLTRVGVRIRSEGSFALFLSVGRFRFRLFPKKPKKVRPMRAFPKEKAPKRAKKKKASAKKEKTDVPALLETALAVLRVIAGWLPGVILVDLKKLAVTVASPDAATTAVEYGASCGAVTAVLELLDRTQKLVLPSKKEDLSISVDYLGTKPSFAIDVRIATRVVSLLVLAFRVFKAYLSTRPSPEIHSGQRKESPT